MKQAFKGWVAEERGMEGCVQDEEGDGFGAAAHGFGSWEWRCEACLLSVVDLRRLHDIDHLVQ